MLMRFDPFNELDRVANLIHQTSAKSVTIPMDAYREGDRFLIHFDLPGIDPKSVDLTVEKNVLTVRAQRRWEVQQNQEVVISERSQGEFTRQLFLGETLDSQNIQASYESGVLTLVIPVAEQAKPRKIQISSAGSGAQQIGTNAGSSSESSSAGQGDGAKSGASAG